MKHTQLQLYMYNIKECRDGLSDRLDLIRGDFDHYHLLYLGCRGVGLALTLAEAAQPAGQCTEALACWRLAK